MIAFFCPTSWVILKQLDPSPSRTTNEGARTLLACCDVVRKLLTQGYRWKVEVAIEPKKPTSWTYWRGWGWILHRSLTERKRSVFSQINPSNRCPKRKIKLLFNLLVCEGWDFAISKPRKDVYPGQQQDTQEFVSRGPEQKEDDVDLFLRWIFHFYSTFLKDIHSS